jgi:2-polyprenyl-6-methoxyphenol hydroxylase-like FAD-dependent oxidoreductase
MTQTKAGLDVGAGQAGAVGNRSKQGTRKAIIIGGSLGGLLGAIQLRAAGWAVEVFERAGDDLTTRGAGIGTHDELFDILRRMGIVVDDSIGVLPLSRTILDPVTGEIVDSIHRPRVLSSWGRLYRALKDALPEDCYHFGMTLESFEQGPGGVVARFTDGSSRQADILVGADGLRSTVRTQLLPDVRPRYAGYIAWRGLLPEADMPADLHREVFDHQILNMPEGQNIVAYPVPGPDNDLRPGHRAYNFVWYHPVEEHTLLRDMCTDASGRYFEQGIPPPLIRPEWVPKMREFAHGCFSRQFRQIIDLTPNIFFQPIFDLESPHVAVGRVVLIGDAAFVARPHVAMGVTKAALDAECLAEALVWHGDDIDAALAEFDAEQTEFGRRVIARARHVGAHLEAQNKPREQRTPHELHRDPVWFMKESGARLCDIEPLRELVAARHQRRDERRQAAGVAAG